MKNKKIVVVLLVVGALVAGLVSIQGCGSGVGWGTTARIIVTGS